MSRGWLILFFTLVSFVSSSLEDVSWFDENCDFFSDDQKTEFAEVSALLSEHNLRPRKKARHSKKSAPEITSDPFSEPLSLRSTCASRYALAIAAIDEFAGPERELEVVFIKSFRSFLISHENEQVRALYKLTNRTLSKFVLAWRNQVELDSAFADEQHSLLTDKDVSNLMQS